MFESLDAFRRHCGEPTMPLERCPICNKIPARCRDEEAAPPELSKLEHFIGEDVQRCPTCHRLYFYESIPLGNDIYTGNDRTWGFDRCDVDVLFDLKWCVQQRLPGVNVSWVYSEQFFPNHVLVSFGGNDWGALDRNNQLVILDSHEAIAKLIDCDPPRVTGDVELAKRYAIFIDERENPGDRRPGYWNYIWPDEPTPAEQQLIDDVRAASGIGTGIEPRVLVELPSVVERDGDRVIVRSWVTSKKRLIFRVITVQPDGHCMREDAVIAENLPMR